MATIPTDRMYPYTKSTGEGPPTLNIPVAASQTCILGVAMRSVAGQAAVMGTANVVLATAANSGLGITEQAFTTPAANTPVPLTILLPNFIWEGSFTGGAAANRTMTQADLGITVATVNNTATGYCVLDQSNTTTPSAHPFAFVGQMFAVPGFPYLDKAAASASISSTNFVPNVSKGSVVGTDVNVRVLFMWVPGACSLLQPVGA